MTRLEISTSEHQERVLSLKRVLEANGFSAMCVFGPVRISYLTGFHFAATERPVCLVVPVDGDQCILVPQLEIDHVRQQAPQLEHVRTYPEYPGGGSGRHPMLHLLGILDETGLTGAPITADLDGYEHRWGYRGPTLSQVLGRTVVTHMEFIDDLRIVKSSAEIALVREACVWGDRAHHAMADLMVEGASELSVSQEASLATTSEMLRALGQRYVPKSREGMPANAMFIRGSNTSNPHGLHGSEGLQRGDVIITGAFGVVGGYESELERTMFFGAPSAACVKYFEAMLAAQDVAFSAIRPGRTCSDVEREVSSFIRDELSMGQYMRHHTGHSFGMEGHEHPFLDLDDHTPIQAGMILSVEPGIYVPALAGFRHSDTVLVTEGGCERLSLYPRELSEMIIER